MVRINQLALQLESNRNWEEQWTVLPAGSRKNITWAFARLCVRAARVTAPRTKPDERDPCNLNR